MLRNNNTAVAGIYFISAERMHACGKRPTLLMYFFAEERLLPVKFRTSFTLVNCASFIILGENEKCFLMNNISRVLTTVVSFRYFAIKITAIFPRCHLEAEAEAVARRKFTCEENYISTLHM